MYKSGIAEEKCSGDLMFHLMVSLQTATDNRSLPCRGRKKAALTYVLTYTLGCFTKHWGVFTVLLVGRLFCGVATSLLYSAFESWLVAEHFKAILFVKISGLDAEELRKGF